MLDFQAARWLMDGEVAEQAGNNHPTVDPDRRLPRPRDGHINIAVSGHMIWVALLRRDRRARSCSTHPDYATGGAALAEPRRSCTTSIDERTSPARHRRMGRAAERGRRARAGRSTRSTRRSPTRRCTTSACVGRSIGDVGPTSASRYAEPHAGHGRRRTPDARRAHATRSCASSATTTPRSSDCSASDVV